MANAADLEILKLADRAHTTAGERLDAAYQAAIDAQAKEYEAGEKREKTYNKALRSGFIIERILEQGEIEYMAGYIGDNAEWLALDESHAEQLQGVFGSEVRARFPLNVYSRSAGFPRSLEAQAPMIVSFNVQGVNGNQKVASNIYRDDEIQGDVTSYQGSLEAIEWRLPTKQEVRQFAGSLAAAEA